MNDSARSLPLTLAAFLLLGACGDDGGQSNLNGNHNDAAPVCGNGRLETGEQCDQGAANSDLMPDACRTSCRTAHCGDGVRDTGEVCDGGDLAGRECTTLPGSTFTGGELRCTATCEPDLARCFTCGNGTAEPGEDCDGFDLAGHGCPDVTSHQQGVLRCHADCTFDPGDCHTCGDQVAEGGEVCDGSDLRGATCAGLGQGFTGGELGCTDLCALGTARCATCGNGVREPGEACDGAVPIGQTCTSVAGRPEGELACGADCALDTGGCHACGDGVAEGPEHCDGADLQGYTCTALGPLSDGRQFHGGTLICAAGCTVDLAGCEAAGWCGDGILQPDHEACDEAQGPLFACSEVDPAFNLGNADCRGCEWHLAGCATCGDGIATPPVESCDDQNPVDWDGCSFCQVSEIHLASPPTEASPTDLAAWGAHRSAVALDGRAAVAATWFTAQGDPTSSMGHEILAWFLDASGAPVGSRRVVASAAGEQHVEPALAFAADGRLLVAWAACADVDLVSRHVSGCRAWARWYDDAFDPEGAPFELDPGVTGELRQLSVAADAASGRLLVLWSKEREAPGGSGIRGQWFDASGLPAGAPFDVSAASERHDLQPHGAFDAAGELLVAWASIDATGSAGTVVTRRFDLHGLPLEAPRDLQPGIGPGVLLLGPRVAFEPGGTALVAWNHCTSFQSCPRLEGLTLDPGGSPSPKVMVANGLNLPPAPMVSLLVRSPGEFSVVYPEDLAGSISVLWHQRLDAGALPLGAATPLDRGQAISGRLIPGIDGAYLPDGRHLITLRYGIDTGSVGVFSNDSILALQRFEPDGTPLGNQAW